MATKIQVKRGSKAGVPNLSPGEFGLATDTNELFIGGASKNLEIPVLGDDGKVKESQLPEMDNDYYLLKGGTEIPESADLNTYTTPGNYCCRSNSAASTLSNSPSQKAFTMKIELGNGTHYQCQILREYDTGNIYRRVNNTTSSTTKNWSAWKQYAFVDDIKLSRLGVTATADELNVLDGGPNTVSNNLATLSLAPTIRVPDDGDLDDYLTPGSYLIRDSASASSIQNSPITESGYDLHVLQTYGLGSTQTYRTQIAVTYMGRIFSRYRNSAGAFSAWKEWKLDGTTLSGLGITATASELNKLDGVTATTQEINYVDGVTSPIQGQLDEKVTKKYTIPDIENTRAWNYVNAYHADGTMYGAIGVFGKAGRCSYFYIGFGDSPWNSAASLIVGDGQFTYQNNEIYYKGNPPSLADLGLTATAAELNKLDGVTATTRELNYVDGVTSSIQTQLNSKAASSHTHGAGSITAGTFGATGVKAAAGTDYTTARVRNIQASTTDLTAGSSTLDNGSIYLVYE